MVNATAGELGGLDGVVVNVGIGLGMGLAGTSADDWDTVFAVNTRAHFLALPGGAAGPPGEPAGLVSSRRSPGCGPAAGSRPTTRRRRPWPGSAATSPWRAPARACGSTSSAPGSSTRRWDGCDRRPAQPNKRRAAGPPGHGVGGRRRRRVPAIRRRQLHHRPGARRRRRPHHGMTGAVSARPRRNESKPPNVRRDYRRLKPEHRDTFRQVLTSKFIPACTMPLRVSPS